MRLVLSIENSWITAATVTNSGDFVWQYTHPIAEDGLPSLLASCSTLVDMASSDNPCLEQTISINAQSSFIVQPNPHDNLTRLASVDLKLNLQASLGSPSALASSG